MEKNKGEKNKGEMNRGEMNRGEKNSRACATINLPALRANFRCAQKAKPEAKVVACIKANAYGHGLVEVAKALPEADLFAVAFIDEALALRAANINKGILLLSGFASIDEIPTICAQGFQFVIHSLQQLECLQKAMETIDLHAPLTLWLKLDSGMHRLGLSPDEFQLAFKRLQGQAYVKDIVLMSHLACAAELDNDFTAEQQRVFEHNTKNLAAEKNVSTSLAASAGILVWPQTHYQWLRPGIMLYGGSPVEGVSAQQYDLQTVMTLSAGIMAIRELKAGDAIGYGSTYVCPQETTIGVVSIGYGDGYPRHAGNGTPVLVKGRRSTLLGRVSMDMITVDLSEIEDVKLGDEVILWGEGLPADEVADCLGTISYALFCGVTARVHFKYLN